MSAIILIVLLLTCTCVTTLSPTDPETVPETVEFNDVPFVRAEIIKLKGTDRADFKKGMKKSLQRRFEQGEKKSDGKGFPSHFRCAIEIFKWCFQVPYEGFFKFHFRKPEVSSRLRSIRKELPSEILHILNTRDGWIIDRFNVSSGKSYLEQVTDYFNQWHYIMSPEQFETYSFFPAFVSPLVKALKTYFFKHPRFYKDEKEFFLRVAAIYGRCFAFMNVMSHRAFMDLHDYALLNGNVDKPFLQVLFEYFPYYYLTQEDVAVMNLLFWSHRSVNPGKKVSQVESVVAKNCWKGTAETPEESDTVSIPFHYMCGYINFADVTLGNFKLSDFVPV